MSVDKRITPRNFNFNFPDDLDPKWVSGNVYRAHFFNGVSLTMPYLEPYLCKTNTEARKFIRNPNLLQDIKDFNSQEYRHHECHKRLNSLLRKNGYPEFEEVEKEYFEKKQSTSLEEARILKRELRKKANKRNSSAEDKANWLKAVELHSFLLKVSKEKEGKGAIRKQENLYRKNFFRFAKDACNGTLGEERVQPTFSKEQADLYFSTRYGTAAAIDTDELDWFVEVEPPTIPFNQDPIRPCEVKEILRKKAANTAPGEDGVLFGVLARLPTLHHVLATLYTRTTESSLAPASWANSLVVLV